MSSSVDLNDDQGPTLKALMIAMLTVPTVAVSLRFWSRAILPGFSSTPIRFWWDDWTALLAAMLNITMCGIGLEMAKLGLGKHAQAVPVENFSQIMKLLWTEYFIFDTGTSVARASALLFYSRVFTQVQSHFKYALWILHVMNLAWMVGLHIVVGIQCDPIEKVWKPLIPGRCIGMRTLFLGSGISSLIINIFILVLPLPLLWRLQMQMVRKLLIIGVFLVVVVSIGRLVTIIEVSDNLDKDFTWEIMKPTFWLSSEIAISVVSVCLPSIFVFSRRLYHDGMNSLVGSIRHQRPKSRFVKSDIGRTYFSRITHGEEETEMDAKLFNPPQKCSFTATMASAESHVTASKNSSQPPDTGIVVRSDITIT
ncbi:uncharacterized protein ATNIH1004_003916 [Aspergillus tanneri]|uniref:Rhodopsin domain-containing protein n=1 Tax=Aspergillus tanneri TaxID=1220188 RepID=A0A5M9MT24_9EURO|nr:uncharacterized protein ATNIH1004_003916 [Aspergillus tanneri]KAA8648033.1 hypothetical protein ATNIH1004_003916 [Aspergillus tanneri]